MLLAYFDLSEARVKISQKYLLLIYIVVFTCPVLRPLLDPFPCGRERPGVPAEVAKISLTNNSSSSNDNINNDISNSINDDNDNDNHNDDNNDKHDNDNTDSTSTT